MPAKCPQCQKPTVHEVRPFCSERCKNLDMGNWFAGAYQIEGDDYSAISELSEEDIDKLTHE